jgi:hypothetical protein
MCQFRDYKRMCQEEGFVLLGIDKGGKHCRWYSKPGL